MPTAVLALIAIGVLPSTTFAKKLTLPELLDMARAANAGLQASAAATNAMEAQVSEARRNWLPSGDVLSILAPSPNIRCRTIADGGGGIDNCISTYIDEPTPQNTFSNLGGVFTRTEVKLIQPVWDFGKISAGVNAAQAGVGVARARQDGARADLELNVRKAYYGLKLARELLSTLEEGSGYIDDGQKRVDKDLSEGTGTVTVTDRLRLRTIRAEVDARLLEARRLGNLARDSLTVLVGATGAVEIDDEALEPVVLTERPLTYYEDQARFNRPEIQMLNHAVKAKWALADLERRKEYPDLVLVGTAALAFASNVDNPKNAFLSHYYNTATAGIAAALRVQLDLGPKLARADRTRAEAREIEFRRTEALGGIALDVRRAYGELTEAIQRTEAVHKGERAGKAWISAVAQNFAVGLAEARDLSDALLAFFQMRARYLQSVFDLNVAAAALARATGASSL